LPIHFVIAVWLLKALTEFGDLGLLTSLATAMLTRLLLMRSPRGAAWWAVAVMFCTGLTPASKVLFLCLSAYA
jgi:hypothetical protein